MKKIKDRKDLEERMARAAQVGAEVDVLVAKFNQDVADLTEEAREEVIEKKAEYDEIVLTIEEFAQENKKNADYFGESRTISLLAGAISWKLGKPAVETGNGFDVETFPKLARKLGFEEIIRTPPEELDKNAVIRLYSSGELTDDQLKKLGLKVDSEDGLTIKFKKIDKKKLGA